MTLPQLVPAPRWTERFPLVRLPWPAELLVAAVATAAAAGLRWMIGEHLPPGFPFLTFFPVVIVTAFLLGSRAGVFTAILSGLAAWYLFLDPVFSWQLSEAGQLAMIFYSFITATEVALVHWMQRANAHLMLQREANAQLARTRELLFKELQHRVSNNLQMVAALLTVQRRQIQDAEAKAALDEASRRLAVIGRISRQLYDPQGEGQQLHPFLDQLASDVIESNGRLGVLHKVESMVTTRLTPEATIPLALVVAEAISNAIEHGFEPEQDDCQVTIRVRPHEGERLAIEVEDNGRGLPAGFSLDGSNSLGLRIATMLAAQLGGSFALSPGRARGAVARLEMPATA